MKIIDLLNKIANGEEVPKKIVIKNVELIYNEDLILNLQDCYYKSNVENATWDIWAYQLNDEVEILEEEKKIPEKLGDFDLTTSSKLDLDLGLELHYGGVSDTFNDVYHKINEIIDYLDYLKSKGNE